MSKVVGRFDVRVDSIKRVGPHAFEVRAYAPSEPNGRVVSIHFEMDDPVKAPFIDEGLLITVENKRVDIVT